MGCLALQLLKGGGEIGDIDDEVGCDRECTVATDDDQQGNRDDTRGGEGGGGAQPFLMQHQDHSHGENKDMQVDLGGENEGQEGDLLKDDDANVHVDGLEGVLGANDDMYSSRLINRPAKFQ